jgi:GTP-binding protein
VGKSSLLNALLARKNLVRIGSTPGTTRQLNWFRARAADGLELIFVDLPGYGFAKRAKHEKSRWGPLIEGYLSNRVTLRAVVLLVDARRGAESEERDLLDYLRTAGAKTARGPVSIIVVATKIDKLAGTKRKPAIERISRQLGLYAYEFSSTSGEGREDLWRALRQAVIGRAPGT